MNINRHNYEEYFILYMDNELSSADRRTVETFVQNNPDLKEELDVLFQSKLAPDNNIVFEGKDELMKTFEDAGITMNNYEEWLVLYIDNELSARQKEEVEKFMLQHPAAKAELELLSKTQFQPEEEIVFPNKELLYRRIEKVRVIQMRWWRIVAAAMLILAVGITAAIILSNKKSSIAGNGLASTPGKAQKTTIENLIVTNKGTNDQKIQPSAEETMKQKINPLLVKHNNNVVKEKAPSNLATEIKKNEPVVAENKIEKPSNHLAQPINNPNITTEISEKSISGNEKALADLTSPSITKTDAPVTTNTLSTSDKIENTSEKKNDDALMYASETNAKKNNSLRGFFRKVTRTFEKRTKINPADEDGRVMIAGLAVNLK